MNTITAKQRELIVRLRAERELSPLDLSGFTVADASAEIERLFAMPRVRAAKPAAVQVTELGIYRNAAGTIYKVQASRETGRLYALELNITSRTFSYAKGAIYTLTAADRLTIAEARAFGAEYGFCCVCAALLTDPKSVAMGIGPVCAKRWF